MMKQHFIPLFILMIVCLSCSGPEDKQIRIGNGEFTKSFPCDTVGPGSIRPVYYRKRDDMMLSHPGVPYFAFIINGKTTSSEDELWAFKDMAKRQMKNGGTEYTLHFKGTRAHVRGLQIRIIQQVFPGSTLVREKLVLYTTYRTFTLHKQQGKLYFRFPQYAVQAGSGHDAESVEIRIASWEGKSSNHMYFPDVRTQPLQSGRSVYKGPIHLLTTDSLTWMTAYEHASQDNINGLLREENLGEGNLINDAMQGTRGIFHFPLLDSNFAFLGISTEPIGDHVNVAVDALRGAYLEGEVIDAAHPYETVWTATAFYDGRDIERGKEIIRKYLFDQICEFPASRKPEFYYNTWGMQREDRTRPLRGILTYDRIFEEIEYAAQLGVDIFVLDDGWQQAQGVWTPHAERLPEGLAPVREKLDEYGIKMGLWFSTMGIDSTTQRYRQHPEWVIKDSEGKPVKAQWGHPAFDFVSDFSDLFIRDCKRLIDQGCRFMKWDAINTFYSTLPGLDHGSAAYSPEEIRARYEYLLPVYVLNAMEELTRYEPELVIETDLTEARRVMMGLAPLSRGILFFMNNGASWYNDYSAFRTKSLRMIAHEYAGLIPLELFTYASYPHDLAGCMEYNVNNALLAGHGFWGDLSLMSAEQRARVGDLVRQSKRVLPYIAGTSPRVIGRVGGSPEIYAAIDGDRGAGQVISFSEEPSAYPFEQMLNSSELLAVLNHPYIAEDDLLKMDLVFKESQSTSAVFVVPNEGSGISILASTAPISDVESDGQGLKYRPEGSGTQLIRWPMELGEPTLTDENMADIGIEVTGDWFMVEIRPRKGRENIVLLASK